MKKIIILLLLFCLTGMLFADPGIQITTGVSENIPTFEIPQTLLLTYYFLYFNIYADLRYTFDTGSDYFQPGIALVIRYNPLLLIYSAFFGSLGAKVYNTFDFGKIELSPYIETDFVWFGIEDSQGVEFSSFIYMDFSFGFHLTLSKVEFDIAYVTPYTNIASDSLGEASSVRIGIGYHFALDKENNPSKDRPPKYTPSRDHIVKR